MSRLQKRKTNRQGTATVEFALCLPVLLALVFGLVEFSRVTQLQQSARLAALEGARAGITLDATTSDVGDAVNRVMTAVCIPQYSTTITPNTLAYTSPSVTVTVSLDPTQNAWLTWFTSRSNLISATVTLQREVQAVSAP